jgi:hypothetical protein
MGDFRFSVAASEGVQEIEGSSIIDNYDCLQKAFCHTFRMLKKVGAVIFVNFFRVWSS